jgi:hypothetical protein
MPTISMKEQSKFTKRLVRIVGNQTEIRTHAFPRDEDNINTNRRDIDTIVRMYTGCN